VPGAPKNFRHIKLLGLSCSTFPVVLYGLWETYGSDNWLRILCTRIILAIVMMHHKAWLVQTDQVQSLRRKFCLL
jgi:hypothetical protein